MFKKFIYCLLLLIYIHPAFADIFQCRNSSGAIIFKDSECLSSEQLVNKIAEEKIDTPAKTKIIRSNHTQEVIYNSTGRSNKTRYLKVSVFEEDFHYLIVEVTGYFSGRPRGTMEFRVTPNIPWASSGEVHATEKGEITAFSRLSLNSSADDIVKSDIISLQLWHYSPANKASFLGTLAIPFKKIWYKNKQNIPFNKTKRNTTLQP